MQHPLSVSQGCSIKFKTVGEGLDPPVINPIVSDPCVILSVCEESSHLKDGNAWILRFRLELSCV